MIKFIRTKTSSRYICGLTERIISLDIYERNIQETNERLGRTNFLFLTYSNQSLLMDLIARDEEI